MKPKLVRDKVPDIIRKGGDTPVTHVADDIEYWKLLKDKLQEEVDEFLKDDNEEELADILEIIEAICGVSGIEEAELEKIKREKAITRGQFKKRTVLDRIEET